MKYDEAQQFLNEQLKFCPVEHQKNIYADKTLSDSEKKDLIEIVSAYKRRKEKALEEPNYKVEAADIKRDLASIAGIMQRYVKPAGKGGQPHSKTLPFLVQQVLCYITALCVEMKWGYTQKAVIRELRDNLGVPISYNFFSRFKETAYIGSYYDQPELPTNYMGQKRGELAVAIKNLVYQAGEYDTFCDIFGGSGAATLAVHRRKNAKYVYNELHRGMYNLFEAMVSDKGHLDLIRDMDALKKDLSYEDTWVSTQELDECALQYFNSKKDNTPEEIEIREKFSIDFLIDEQSIPRGMQYLHDWVSKYTEEDFKFEYDGTEYSKEQLLADIFIGTDSNKCVETVIQNFNNHQSLIMAFDRKVIRHVGSALYMFRGTVEGSETDLMSFISEYGRIRTYKYFAYFRKLLTTGGAIAPKDKTKYAIAEIYMHHFIKYNDMSSSTAHGFFKRSSSIYENGDKKFWEFLNKDYDQVLTDIYEIAKGTELRRLDCIDFISEFQGERTLFYSDSPYIATVDYDDKVNGVGKFDANKMRDLILNLRNSKSRFIFSCRAVVSSELGYGIFSQRNTIKGFKKILKLTKGNRSIRDDVFNRFKEEFEDRGQHLWVLAIEKKSGNTLEKLMRSNGIAEIMITNFRIYPFEDPKFKRIKFRVLTFKTFLKIYDKIFEIRKP